MKLCSKKYKEITLRRRQLFRVPSPWEENLEIENSRDAP